MSIRLKCLHAMFDVQPDFKPYVDFYKFGNLLDFNVTEGSKIEHLNILLKDDVIYDISFDQSTSNTGVFIKAHNNSEIYMIEVCKASNTTPEEYMFELESFLHGICNSYLFLHLIYEKPIKSKNFRSSQVLFQLEGMLRMLPLRYEEFKSVEYGSISKMEWAPTVFDKERYGSNYSDKEAVKQSIISIFPWTQWFGFSLGKDNDGYEAIGVMMGWFYNSFDPLGRPYVRGDSFHGNVGCTILPGVPYDTLYEQLKKEDVNTKWFVYNPKSSIFKNIVKAAEKDCVVLVHVDDPYIKLALSVESNLKLFEHDFFTLVIVTPNFMSAAAKRILGTQFHFYL